MKRFTHGILVCLVLIFTAGAAYAGNVKKGEEIFNDSGLGTNGKSCNTCHSDGKGIDAGKSSYEILGTEQESLEDAVNFCIEMALSGEALNKDSEKMRDLVSYLKSAQGKKQRERITPGY